MTAKILHGEPIASKWRKDIANEISKRNKLGLRAPKIAVILVGDDHASRLYVRNKKAACLEIGILVEEYLLDNSTKEQQLIALIDKLNKSEPIDAILVQLPLPEHINTGNIVEAISPLKDVDGFHPYNLGCLAQGRPTIRPCTPAGVIRLLEHTKEQLTGKTATVIGTSNIVGKPMLLELINAGVTVTACNKKTLDIPQALQKADIIIVAAGCCELIKGEWLKPGVIVIDIGINRDANGKIIGDVEFNKAQEKASWITPVPGGVGPMTIASLLHNTLQININRQL